VPIVFRVDWGLRSMNESAHDIGALLDAARQGDAAALGALLEVYRERLHARASRQLQGPIAARVSPSDLVQVTFLEATRNFPGFEGREEAEWTAWLLRILEWNLASAIRDHTQAEKRAVHRECSLDAPRPAAGPEDTPRPDVAALQSTPSERVMR